LYWVRYVHHFNSRDKTVCCRRGEESYFPSATRYWYEFDEMSTDRRRHGTMLRHNRSVQTTLLRDRLSSRFGDVDFEFPFGETHFDPFAILKVPLVPLPR